MSELEQYRTRLYDALAAELPREEVLMVSERLDALILADMKARQSGPSMFVQGE